MITSLREREFQAKREGEQTNIYNDIGGTKVVPKLPSSSRQWSAFRNPRIVRVSRSFGGKDRHSKVCTIRGLRDRRIRLSVPTAIQLYDLQDRLGLGQPSKVIDWLIEATKDDIDKLPPLPLPQGFGHHQFHHQPLLLPSHHDSSSNFAAIHQSPLAPFFETSTSAFMKDARFHHPLGININTCLGGEGEHTATSTGKSSSSSGYWELESSLRSKNKELLETNILEKGKWIKENEQQQLLSAQRLFPSSSGNNNNHSNSGISLPAAGLLNINPMSPFNSYYHHWDAPNLSLSQYGSHGILSQTENSLISNTTTTAVSLPSGSQLYLCPPPATMSSPFPPYPPYISTTPPIDHTSTNSRSSEMNHFQLLGDSQNQLLTNSRIGLPIKAPFSLNVANPGLVHSQGNNEGGSNNPQKVNNNC